MKGQRLKRFLGKEFYGRSSGGVMDVQVGLLFEPPPGDRPKVFQILEVSSIEEIPFNVLKRGLNLSLRFGPALPARNGLAVIMGDKGREGWIKDRPSAFPAEDHGLFIVIQTFLRHPSVILESILMSSDQGIKI